MTLRTKLSVSFTVLLLGVIAAVGIVASRSVRSILIDQIDRTLFGVASRGPTPEPPGGGPAGPEFEEPFLRSLAEVLVAPDGSVLFARPSGFADDPDPLPDVGALAGASGFTYLDSIDGSLEYRAYVFSLPDGASIVRAAPLGDVATATSSLIRTLLLAGGGVLLLGGAATWWTVRGAMRPVDEMVETAEAIAGGDLTRRVPELDPRTELGRLGGSLNEMLSHIEDAVAVEREGRDRLRRFVADASHELRTPVTAIAGYAQLRRKGGLSSAQDEDRAWSRIESESARMASLIEDLLTLARLGGDRALHVEPIDLADVARDAAADHQAIDRGHPVRVITDAPVPIYGDKERLHQVASNLLSNVRVHTPDGTPVDVEVRDLGDAVELRVTDDGPGIPDHALHHVFDRFYRADPSRSRRSGGSGLGLAIVQAIVTAHGGTVSAGNVEGRGARLTVTLPRAGH